LLERKPIQQDIRQKVRLGTASGMRFGQHLVKEACGDPRTAWEHRSSPVENCQIEWISP